MIRSKMKNMRKIIDILLEIVEQSGWNFPDNSPKNGNLFKTKCQHFNMLTGKEDLKECQHMDNSQR